VRYAETKPGDALAPWVACYWSITATDAPAGADRILPDGCADIIVDLAGEPDAFVVGTMSTALLSPRGPRVELFGIRFRPGAALPFMGVPLKEITDQRVALDVLWGARAGALSEALVGVAPHDRVRQAERILLGRPRRVRSEDEMVPRAVELFRRARGGVAVRDVAAALGVGERRLVRAFDRCVGLSPKGFARVMRFREVFRQLEQGARPWTRIAGDAGYADQPHLIREFQALAGVTPTQYMVERQSQRSRVRFVQASGRGDDIG
jgi:AraC-like DNA-binding protein